jgi:hypothetical protein
LGRGMRQSRRKEWMVISQERQPVDWRACSQSILSFPSSSPCNIHAHSCPTYWRNSSPSLCRNAVTTWIPRAYGPG